MICFYVPWVPYWRLLSSCPGKASSSDRGVAVFVFPEQFKFWAWDPEEERRRQEKWQQEQERLLQVGPACWFPRVW